MKLITENIEDVEYITEENKNGKKVYSIKGVFMQADVKNRNGRVYPKDILTQEVIRYNKDFINNKRAFGELGHPEGPVVNLERVSHMINKLYPDGNNFIGEAKILDTPYGKIVKNLIDEGAKLGVSSRGMGTLVHKDGANHVKDDFYLATAADIVADPSAPNAFVEGVMEGREWVWNNGNIKEQDISALKVQIESAKRAQREDVNARVFQQFLNKI